MDLVVFLGQNPNLNHAHRLYLWWGPKLARQFNFSLSPLTYFWGLSNLDEFIIFGNLFWVLSHYLN